MRRQIGQVEEQVKWAPFEAQRSAKCYPMKMITERLSGDAIRQSGL